MKQFLMKMQEGRLVRLSLFFLIIAGVGAMEAPQMVRMIMVIVLALVGSIASVKVYKKWKSGASDLLPVAMDWYGSFLILVFGYNTIGICISVCQVKI